MTIAEMAVEDMKDMLESGASYDVLVEYTHERWEESEEGSFAETYLHAAFGYLMELAYQATAYNGPQHPDDLLGV